MGKPTDINWDTNAEVLKEIDTVVKPKTVVVNVNVPQGSDNVVVNITKDKPAETTTENSASTGEILKG